MAVTLTTLGTFQSTAGTGGSATASGVTGTNGNLLVLRSFANYKIGSDGSPTSSITGTWSGTWTRRAVCTRGSVTNGQYAEFVELWISPVSGSPSGTIIMAPDIAHAGTPDGWVGFRLDEISGQHASPIGLAANGTAMVSTSTYTLDFGATPASDSLCLAVIHDDNQTGPAVTPPSGWSEDDEQSPAWGAITEWASKNGSAAQTAQWSGFTNSASVRILGCGLEIIAAAGAAPNDAYLTMPPLAPPRR